MTAAGAPSGAARITVIAGVNGAGKSSVVGETVRAHGGAYFNPDEEARALRAEDPGLSQEVANARAWEAGRAGLERAIARREDFAFETTLGGTTISALLGCALDTGLEVVMRYIGLDSPERHIARVRSRVARGGHDIPEATIRERYPSIWSRSCPALPRSRSMTTASRATRRRGWPRHPDCYSRRRPAASSRSRPPPRSPSGRAPSSPRPS